jgi:hypothetical protein
MPTKKRGVRKGGPFPPLQRENYQRCDVFFKIAKYAFAALLRRVRKGKTILYEISSPKCRKNAVHFYAIGISAEMTRDTQQNTPTAFCTAPPICPAPTMSAYNVTGKRAPPWISKRKRPECLRIRRIAVCAEMTPWGFVLRSLFGSPINNTNRSSRLYSYQGPPGDCHSPGPS